MAASTSARATSGYSGTLTMEGERMQVPERDTRPTARGGSCSSPSGKTSGCGHARRFGADIFQERRLPLAANGPGGHERPGPGPCGRDRRGREKLALYADLTLAGGSSPREREPGLGGCRRQHPRAAVRHGFAHADAASTEAVLRVRTALTTTSDAPGAASSWSSPVVCRR